MKKFLLLGTMAAIAATASAASTDYFVVKYNGQEITDGNTIYCNHRIAGLPFEDNYSADVDFISKEGEQLLVISVGPDTTQPGYDGASWGMPQICEGGDAGNCYANQEYYFADISEEGFIWMIEAIGVEMDVEPIYVVNACIAYGERNDYEIEEDSMMTFYIKYSKTDTKVAGIESDSNEKPVYYNLLGKQVTNPSNGVYIVKQGKKVTKQVFGN
ncbi:MAG: hypothetical protein J1E95_06880 [Muribaculaceae bacterium]|nr:hypothetical protein [Muribaculaceae bacterium]